MGGDFVCSNNKITSLKFCPTQVGQDFYCSNNRLTSLEFCPSFVGESFYCGNNVDLLEVQKITDFPEIVKIHQETLIKIEREKLAHELKNTSTDKITFKI